MEKKEIIIKEYYEMGELKKETPFVEGKKHGLERHFNVDGTLKSERLFKDVELIDKKTTVKERQKGMSF